MASPNFDLALEGPIKKRPKFLADFDGVWTDLTGQAAAVHEYRDQRLAQIVGWSVEKTRACISQIQNEIDANPKEHGWRSNGRITAYSDEDPFLNHNSLVIGIELLSKQGNPLCVQLRNLLVENGYSDINVLGAELFQEGCKRYLETAGHKLLPEAQEGLEALLGIADVVFCTNFSTATVEHTWKTMGLKPGRTRQGGHLTIRGNAKKQVLTGDPEQTVEYNGRQVCLDRGHYLQLLEQERPDVVVGDVFSLDLALPLHLRHSRDDFQHLVCLLKKTPFTPAWSMAMCEDNSVPGLFLVESPAQLKDIAARTT